MDNEVYAITNLKGYAQEMRQAAANSLSEDDCKDNLDEFINLNQMVSLIKGECVGFDDSNRPLLNEDANAKIYESTMIWINNVGLAKLAAKNLLECAWDDKTNQMVFWSNNSNIKVYEQECFNEKPVKRKRNKKKN